SRLRDDAIAALDRSHDYYVHTKIAWRLVQRMVRQGHRVTIRNRTTGTTTTETQLASQAQEYVTGYLASATLQDFVAVFERFVLDFISAWLTAHPKSLAGKQLKFRTVLDSQDKDEVVAAVVQDEVVGSAYGPVGEWFRYIEKIAQLGCPSKGEIERIAEIKATRDLLVHNNGVVNAIYVAKSGVRARSSAGERIDVPEWYHRESWELMRQVISDVAGAAIAKT
ncbi:MAG: hypothetical protein ACF8PG_14630, partial [Maioricimonas sp. JB045]